ncbi:hypothetical protein ACFLWR_07090 [Chloroflexota bacterium]
MDKHPGVRLISAIGYIILFRVAWYDSHPEATFLSMSKAAETQQL